MVSGESPKLDTVPVCCYSRKRKMTDNSYIFTQGSVSKIIFNLLLISTTKIIIYGSKLAISYIYSLITSNNVRHSVIILATLISILTIWHFVQNLLVCKYHNKMISLWIVLIFFQWIHSLTRNCKNTEMKTNCIKILLILKLCICKSTKSDGQLYKQKI